ncbi:MAG: nitroreductase family protein, partial [Candidatus Coatesbacteria bacterium]
MHLKDAIKLRRSIRSFQNSDVSSDVIEHILSLAIEAPSAGNLQPWRIIILSKKEDKKEVAKIAYNQNFITQAPYTIINAADTKTCMSVYGVRGRD